MSASATIAPQAQATGSAPVPLSLPRLNPRLTQRRPAPPSEPPPESDSENEETDQLGDEPDTDRGDQPADLERKSRLRQRSQRNKNASLIHPGKWIQKEHDCYSGNVVENTGLWSCCGHADNMSLYCANDGEAPTLQFDSKVYEHLRARHRQGPMDGKAARAAYQTKITLQDKEKELLAVHAASKLKMREEWQAAGEAAKLEPKIQQLSEEDKTLLGASSRESALNAPMLIMWLSKNVEHEPVAMKGLELVLGHMQDPSGEGCQMLYRQGVVDMLLTFHRYYTAHFTIQLHVVCCLRKLLDCNMTRDYIIGDKRHGPTQGVAVLAAMFSVAHCYMNSRPHLDEACRGLAQCSRSECLRRELLRLHIVPFMIEFCKKHSRAAVIVRYTLKVFGWLATTSERFAYLMHIKALTATIQCIKRHHTNPEVLAPGLLFLCRCSAVHPPAMEYLLSEKVGAVAVVIKGLEALFSYERIQLEGLKMLRIMAKTQSGFNQISASRGAWQKITQGTSYGNDLVYELPGDLNNAGWSIGETPHLTANARRRLEASVERLSRTQGSAESHWTPASLKVFMGIDDGTTSQTLAINNDYHNAHYELLSNLHLLPKPGEDRVEWFHRLNEYEEESGIELKDMVETSLEMKRKQAILDGLVVPDGAKEDVLETAKPVYVGGVKITTKFLSENDKSVQETMSSVLG